MRRTALLAVPMILVAGSPAQCQVDARLMRFPAVSARNIAFTYAGDVWVVDKNGGLAHRLSTPAGEESFPRFSPDGSEIAFSGDYDGNLDIYVMPVAGGVPARVTSHPGPDRLIGWTPDGKSLLFASPRESGRDRFNKLFTVAKEGGLPTALPLPYGEYGALSPDGKTLAYLPVWTDFRTWKRYRGGMASEIWFFDLEKRTSRRLPSEQGSNDSIPMWHGGTLYFLSDRDAQKRNNIWAYDLKSGAFRQVTFFKDFDVHFPSIGPEDIVLEAGGRLYRIELPSEKLVEVKVNVATDQAALKPHEVNAAKLIREAVPSPQGKRAFVEARGEVFSVPAERGFVLDLTRTSGAAERFPAVSPDGTTVAYFSDRSGEYELCLRPADGSGEERQVTHLGPGFRYHIFWSPDGKRVVFIDQAMNIQMCELATGKVQTLDQGTLMEEDALEHFRVTWTQDGRWVAYAKSTPSRNGVIMLYDTRSGKLTQATSTYYNAGDAAFDPEGAYLFVTTDQAFSPSYSNVDQTWIYANTSRVAAIPLRKDVPSPLAARNDADPEAKGAKKEDKKDEKKEAKPAVEIDLEGLESRMVLLPPAPGLFADLSAAKGKVVYRRLQQAIPGESGKGTLQYYDLEDRSEKTVLDDVDHAALVPGEAKVLAARKDVFAYLELKPDQKLEKKLPTSHLPMMLDPRAEWRQIFNDAWRLERDMFYDPAMHGEDWKAMRARYGSLLDQCSTRFDVNFVIGELISELNSSHAYRGGGDLETGPRIGVGMLGVDFALENGRYRIKTILHGAAWDADARSSLAQPGVDVHEGDYLLAVNHQPLDPAKDPWRAFQDLAGRTVLLTVNSAPSFEGARDVVVETLPSEDHLRYQAWVEARRAYVEKASGGRIGYIYVPDTGVNGQNDLVRQFQGQWDKPGLIIDERFNSGGQIPDRFVELLSRKALSYWGVRQGMDMQSPDLTHDGPMAMLINGWSGSGGDCFPFFFRKAGLGPIIGRRTWGGLIGISGNPMLIDGGDVTVPTFGMYSTDGHWLIEGHGVDPDIEVIDDPALLSRGQDPQLDRALKEVEDALAKNPPHRPAKPAYPKKAGY